MFLVFASAPNAFQKLKDEVGSQYPGLADFNAFAISPEVEESFGTNKAFSVLLRPDNHVGIISSANSLSRLQEYLVKVVGCER